MSFRIEDILKKDSIKNFKSSSNDEDINRIKRTKALEYCSSAVNNSILQRTLLNKNHSVSYYRSLSEPSKIDSCAGWWHSGKMYTNLHNSSVCNNRGIFCPPLYTRNSYPPYSFNFLPQLYNFSKRKGGQVRFTANQTDALEKQFISHKYLSPEDRRILAESLKLTDRQVKTWFQNRRAKWRRSSSHTEVSSTKSEKIGGTDKVKNIFLESHDCKSKLK